MLIDTHTHLDLYQPEEVKILIKRAFTKGIEKIITVGTDYDSCLKSLSISNQFESVYAAIGIHPHDAHEVSQKTIAELKKLAMNSKVVAIGETGLDYYHNFSPRKKQKDAFKRQIDLSLELNLPLIVHNREAYQDTLEIIREAGSKERKVVFHCFSGSLEMGKELIKMGYLISIAGPITFQNARRLSEVVRELPLSHLLLETDSPYLTPHPFRGKTNEPSLLTLIAEKISFLKEVTLNEVAKITTNNAYEVFSF